MSGLPGVQPDEQSKSIVQGLGRIQREHGYLPADAMAKLAETLGEPQRRLHEVASFFPLYRLEKGPEVDVRVCRDVACHLRGAPALEESLRRLAAEVGGDGKVIEVSGVSCLGQCDGAPAVCINDHSYPGLTSVQIRDRVRDAIQRRPASHHHAGREPLEWKIDPYRDREPYAAVKKLVATRDPATGALRGVDGLLEELKTSTLSGMGGARFPTFRKWAGVRALKADAKYVVCNGDECEPGTFKDRELLRRAPHLLVEGMVLAGLTVGATRGYIYIRHEYHEEIEAVERAISGAMPQKCCGHDILGSGHSFPVEVFVSPGGYICGEETALLEAMEDRRAEPRNKPPFPHENGYRSKPTVINNVETLMWTPSIYLNGGAWYRDLGVLHRDAVPMLRPEAQGQAAGMWFCSISGDVNKPGVYEVPFGITVNELIFKYAGKMRDGRSLKAIATSGPSGGFIPKLLDRRNVTKDFAEKVMRGKQSYDIQELPLDYRIFNAMSKRPLQYMLGAAFVAVGDGTDMVDLTLNLTEFFRNESCGKCVPCRLGSQKLVDFLRGDGVGGLSAEDMELGEELGKVMVLTSICGLGQVAPNPLLSLLEHFPDEVAAYVARRVEINDSSASRTIVAPVARRTS